MWSQQTSCIFENGQRLVFLRLGRARWDNTAPSLIKSLGDYRESEKNEKKG